MIASSLLENTKAEHLWSNISGTGHFALQAYTYQRRLMESQMRNEHGSDAPTRPCLPSTNPPSQSLSTSTPVSSLSIKDKNECHDHTHRINNKHVHFTLPNDNVQGLTTIQDDSEAASTLRHSNKVDVEAQHLGDQTIEAATPGKYTNEPHPSLELPLFYLLLKRFPYILENVKKIYQFRWSVSYPLQKRVYCSNYLRKLNIHMTWGELILLMPLFGIMLAGTLYTFAFPSLSRTGYFARLPLLFAVGSAMRNSIVTLLIGMSFERALWYHKLAGRIAFINGVFHTYIAYAKPVSLAGGDFSFFAFTFGNVINTSGTLILVLMTGLMLSSLPYVRHKFFEVFYYIHILFVAMMAVCAFYHSGIVVPVVAVAFWGTDLIIRKIIMAGTLYPRKASARVISDTVVEISFPKTEGFSYNPGQFIYIAIPQISLFEWHPFSISSCPMQSTVTIHIRKVGTWTGELHKLAKRKPDKITIMLEGPYGSPSIDITSNRYKNILLFGGGIGITPIQSLSNQLIYDYSNNKRELKRLSVIWIERDPVMLHGCDVVRRSSSMPKFSNKGFDLEGGVFANGDDNSSGIASTLLSLVPVDQTTDCQLALDYPMEDSEGSFRGYINVPSTRKSHRETSPDHSVDHSYKSNTKMSDTQSSTVDEDDRTIVSKAYQSSSLGDILDLQVFLTSNERNKRLSRLPFVRFGRPNINQIFSQMRENALLNGEKRVAVYVCAPARLAQMCRKSCVKFLDDDIQFDFHVEGPE